MKYIDLENWKRKNHFNFFKNLDYPQYNISGNIDITNFYKYIKEHDLPFFVSMIYVATKAANLTKEFRLRIREDKVVEHETVNPSFTVLVDDELFSFCAINYVVNFDDFKNNTLIAIEKVKNHIILEDEPGRDDLLFISSITWISFTSISHPINMNPVESIPRITWGKYFEESGKVKLPLSIQVHHGLVDGIHVGKYFNTIQEILNNPEKHLSK